MRRDYPLLIVAVALAFAAVTPGHAKPGQVYNGITQQELLDFARQRGWEAKASGGGIHLVIDKQRAILSLTGCDARGRCRSGRLRSMSFFFIRSRYFIRNWNLSHFGATGFSNNYVTLQRHVHFVGVTDAYLQAVIGRMWVSASKKFWADVRKVYDAERGRTAK